MQQQVGTNLEASSQIQIRVWVQLENLLNNLNSALVLCIRTDMPNGNAHGCILMMISLIFRVLAGHRQADNPTTDAASRWGFGGNGPLVAMAHWGRNL